ncbi:MAG: DUF814 domain-containing protein [Candidatus Sericytochromatia bacterium]|nr:DUF814 domain-containing protein [Candidatus Sericytochromatia bacterium]
MTLRYAQLQALQPELVLLLQGARLQQVREPAPRQYQLDFYQPGQQQDTVQRHSLLLDLSQGQSWLLLQPQSQPGQPRPSGWCMLLRKHLLNQTLQQITLATDDRLLQLHFSQNTSLILELSGRHANLFLNDAAGQVLGAAHRDASVRRLQTGLPYCPPSPPPPRTARDPLQLSNLTADGARSAALWQHYQQQRQQTRQQQQVQALLRGLQQELSRLEQRLQQAWADLTRGEAAEDWQMQGELLRAAFGRVSPGQSEVQVPDYYQPGAPLRRIALDPAKDLAGNIQRCFQQVRRCERAAAYALEQLPRLEAAQTEKQNQQSQLLDWQTQLRAGPLPAAAMAELQLLWQAANPAPTTSQRSTPQSDRQVAWHFTSRAGESIWVGKTDRDNQTLLRQAKSSDFWLHLRHGSSAHVLVPSAKKQQPDNETLLDAATLALVHSSAYRPPFEGLTVEIWIARVHQLRRPKGAKPGQVQVLPGARTLQLRFEPERLQRLQASRC